jgi:hypothetical protein
MNDLGLAVLRAALQGTMLALVAVPLYLLAARRGPRAGSLVASLYLALSGLLVLVALSPQPSWWTWARAPDAASGHTPLDRFPISAPRNADIPAAHEGAISDGTGGLTRSLAWLQWTWHRLDTLAPAVAGPGLSWISLVAFGFLAGSGLSLLRFALGLSAVRALRRRGRPITDAALHALTEALRRELAYKRPVALGEARELGSPATIGWRCPLVLLPEDWRHWSEAERRAVLAHELAHVSRADYLRGLVARLSIALQFYQPLVYWLAGRLQLQQELAADALAAPVSGGRGPYLRALSEMALRQHGRLRGWPAPAFLSLPGTLMRRIHMLRTHHGSPERALPRTLRAALIAVLLLTAGAVSTLRTPAGSPRREEGPSGRRSPSSAKENHFPQAQEAAAFDLTYLTTDYPGVIALRPGAVLGRPELKKLLPWLNREFRQESTMLVKTKGGLDLPLEEIEQVICPAVIRTDRNAPADRRSQLITTLNLVRTVHDFDWKRQLKALAPELEEASYAGRVYYRTPKITKNLPFLFLFAKEICFYIPDGRTLVMLNEPALHRILDGQTTQPIWAKDWKQVEHGLAAVAFDSRNKSWLEGRVDSPPDEIEAAALPICREAQSVVIGLDASRGMSCRFLLRTDSSEAGRKVAAAAERVLALARADSPEPPWADLVTEALRQTQIQRHGATVTVRSEVKEDLGQLLTMLVGQLPAEMLK